ncbi:Tyrosine-protein phosphatase YwqE [Bhargavaea cecembensis DSE10]|uniref:Tyrosine-protein phosphatase n=1 Tax=Bhargavaea cecembensis DSE10 TaxID=1235279 RepID=M7NHA0_9BACL|nr:CpsB/CapC family capsule biosynthesis tyrosine phosphatase [Bhargavaea cecembensis]EMR06566.1 Tyrosine-protein phosphatase YwqE [Bhargavaea cecembensis DSE10]
MIDTHAHILYGVDDGPATLEDALEMLSQAEAEGITDITATSHALHPQFHAEKEDALIRLQNLQRAADQAGIKVKIHQGHEVRIKDDIVERFDRGELLTLAGSKYLLIELPSSGIPGNTTSVINEFLSRDILPVIVHPERNRAIIDKPERLARLINHGALAQVTAGSLAGKFGNDVRDTALQLIDANLIHLYGSDAHDLRKRNFFFDKGLTYLERKKHADAVDIFLENNARVIEHRDPVILEPAEPAPKKKWFIFG